jgi:hypothetical protein
VPLTPSLSPPRDLSKRTEGGARVAVAAAGVGGALCRVWVCAERDLPPREAMHGSILVTRRVDVSLSSSDEERVPGGRVRSGPEVWRFAVLMSTRRLTISSTLESSCSPMSSSVWPAGCSEPRHGRFIPCLASVAAGSCR